ncbi:MAG: DUF4127 family protein [Armatimonadota bacterium]
MSIRHRVHRVVYLPLDDRPCNSKHVQMLARMVDYELMIPPMELLGRYTKPGDPEALTNWLLNDVTGDIDCVVLSLDMLAYGGLVASRATDVRTELALKRMDVLSKISEKFPEAPVFASNIIMRLSITADSDKAAVNWQMLRDYSELQGRVEAHGDDEDRRHLEKLEETIPASLLGKYRACRDRNHQVNLRAIEETARGNIDFLVLGQEDAAEYGPHVKEQDELKKVIGRHGLSDRILIYPGADEIGQTLLARFVHQHMQKVPRAYIMYANPDDAENVATFEDRPFTETLRGHMKTVGVEFADSAAQADFVLAINPPADGMRDDYSDGKKAQKRQKQASDFAARITDAEHDRRVALCDVAFANGAEECFVEALIGADIRLPGLLSFSAWNTAGNSVGSALAQSSLRLIALQDKGAFDLANILVDLQPMRYLQLLDTLIDSEKAHVHLLLCHLADDWLYQTRVRPAVTDTVVNMLEASIFDLADSRQRVQHMVSDQLVNAVADLYTSHFLGEESVQIGSGDNTSGLALAELEETRVSLPWDRLFEVDLDFNFGIELVART